MDLFISYRAEHQPNRTMPEGNEFEASVPRILASQKQYWSCQLRERGYFAVTSRTITDETIIEYVNEQEGELVRADDGRFPIDLKSTPLELLAFTSSSRRGSSFDWCLWVRCRGHAHAGANSRLIGAKPASPRRCGRLRATAAPGRLADPPVPGTLTVPPNGPSNRRPAAAAAASLLPRPHRPRCCADAGGRAGRRKPVLVPVQQELL